MMPVLDRNGYGNDSHAVLLIHSDTTNEDTNFVDSSRGGTAHTITPVNGADHSTNTAKFGATSIDCIGTGNNYLSIPYVAGDFGIQGCLTIDTWVNLNSIQTFNPFCGIANANGADRFFFGYSTFNSVNELRVFIEVGGSLTAYNIGTTLSTSTWYHVSATIDTVEQKIIFFLDGELLSTQNFTQTNTSFTQPLTIGSSYGADGTIAAVQGTMYFDEFRFSKGICRHKRSFTPPNRPY